MLVQVVREHDRVFDRHAATLAEIWSRRMRSVAQQAHAAVRPSRDRFSIVNVRSKDALCRRCFEQRAYWVYETRESLEQRRAGLAVRFTGWRIGDREPIRFSLGNGHNPK